MTNKKLSTFGKNYRRLIYTYFIVMVFPLIVGIVMTFILNHETGKAITENYEDRLSYSADTLDQILRNVGSCAYTIATDKDAVSYSKITMPLTDAETEYLKKTLQASIISELNVNEQNIADIIVSFPQCGVMLSTQRTYRYDDRNNLCKTVLGMTYEEVLQLTENTKGRDFYISTGENNAGNPVPFLIQTGLGKNSKTLSAIIVLKSSSLLDALAYSSGKAVIGSSNTDFFTEKDNDIQNNSSFMEYLFSEEVLSKSPASSSQDYVTFAKKSSVSKWNYILVLDKTEYQRTTDNFRLVLILIFSLTVLLGVLIIFRISRFVYSPVWKLIGAAGEEYQPTKGEDEFDFLSGVFKKLRENNILDEPGKNPKDNSLVSLTLNRILCQNSWPNDQLAEKLRLQRSDFLISILDIEFLSENLLSNRELEEERLFFQDLKKNLSAPASGQSIFYYNRMNDQDKQQINYSTYNIVSELLDSEDILMTLVEGNLVLILLLSENAEERQRQLVDFDRTVSHCCDILRSRAGIAVSAVVGEPTESKEQLYDRYNSLKLYLRKKHFLGASENRVIYPSREQQAEPKHDKSYEIENAIGNKIVAKEYDVAYQMLESFFDYVLKHSADYSLQLLQLRMYGMIYVLITSLGLDTSGQPADNELPERDSLLSPEFLLASENILELRSNVQLLFRELIELHQNDLQRSVIARSEEIRDYVNKHAFSPEICASSICNEFHISASYLSRLFKQTTGNNLLKYIHGIRIARAKELLESTDISVNDIADLVGFSDRRSFDRVFSSTVKTTPYNYRAEHQKEE